MTDHMAVVFPSDGVLELLRSATDRVIIAAPYIKSPTISRLLETVSDTVSECTCITRWLPQDIAFGVCDLEIFDDIARVKGARLMVHPHLHAKYYSNGQQCLVGSANLTARGLGWHTPSNIELLVKMPANSPGLPEWEDMLLSSAVVVTKQLRDQIHAQSEQLRQSGTFRFVPEVGDMTVEGEKISLWVPKCPTPNRLWEVYRGRGADTMVSSAYEAAREDLAALSPPLGLTQNLFKAYVAGILRQMPLLTEIDNLAVAGLTDTKAYEFLADRLASELDYRQVWHVVKQWLVFFFSDSYMLETSQEVLIKGRQIPTR